MECQLFHSHFRVTRVDGNLAFIFLPREKVCIWGITMEQRMGGQDLPVLISNALASVLVPLDSECFSPLSFAGTGLH